MGIKGLWPVLSPFSEKKSLHEIRGQTLAIDLSGWVCDSQNVTDYHVQPKLYLRNLFFRTVYLILSDINPIFVLEGDAPDLKRDVMAARNAVQFRGVAPRAVAATGTNKRPDTGRRRYKGVQKECENLLKTMGVCSIKGSGEAEATCAELNSQGLVDAVISQDSDCFAYGAVRVYRNFSVSSAAGGGAMQGSVDCYDAGKMFQSNGFGRKKMVALALLCGCDYGVGACGSSMTSAVAFLHTVPEEEVIPRLLSWVTETEHYEKQARWAAAPGRCDRCGHVGRTHLKNGCPVCATHKGCNDLGHKAKVGEVKRELSLRNRALTSGMVFPEPKVMKEFLKRTPDTIDMATLKRPAPSLIQFIKVMSLKVGWSERYCVEKFLPLLTKWHLQDSVPCRTIRPVAIKKKRAPKGVPSFEVVWEDIDGHYEALIPDNQYDEDEDRSVPWTSTERQDLMRQYYPDIVAAYEESIKKPVKEKKTRERKKNSDTENTEKPKRKYTRKPKVIENIDASMKALNITDPNKLNVSVKVNKLKRKIKTNKKGAQKKIDSFIEKKRKRTSMKIDSLSNSFKNISLVNDDLCFDDIGNDGAQNVDRFESKKGKNRSLLQDSLRHSFRNSLLPFDKIGDKENAIPGYSEFGDGVDEVQESDLSDIVERMISKPPITKTVKLNNKLVRLIFDSKNTPQKISKVLNIHNHCSTPKDSPVRRRSVFSAKFGSDSLNNSLVPKVNTSFFFDKLSEDRDAFELSMDHKSAVINLECDSTVEYSLPDVIL